VAGDAYGRQKKNVNPIPFGEGHARNICLDELDEAEEDRADPKSKRQEGKRMHLCDGDLDSNE